jgi:hypothetical protein
MWSELDAFVLFAEGAKPELSSNAITETLSSPPIKPAKCLTFLHETKDFKGEYKFASILVSEGHKRPFRNAANRFES